MAELSSYPAVTTLAGTERFPLVTTPGIAGGNKYITAVNLALAILADLANLAADPVFSNLYGPTTTTPEAYGAVRDGTTDDTTAFNAAQATLTAGGVVTLSKGTYKAKIAPTKGGVTYKGAGMWATTLIPPAATTYQIEWAAVATDIAFEDMAFDFSTLSTGNVALLNGVTTRNVRFTRCRFYNVPDRFIASQGLTGLVVEGCLFHTPGNPLRGGGVYLSAGTRKVDIHNNTFLYCNTGVSSSTNCDDVRINNNYFDQGWWLGASTATGTGGPVTYTATVLTDTGANFATLPSNGVGSYVRTMATRRTNSGGTVTYTYSQNLLVDTAASFVADGVLKGEIIRVGSIFGVVESVVSATTLQVEQWLSSTTYLPVAEPAAGTAYTAYKIVLGYVTSGTATTLTVTNWYNLDGTVATPSAGTLYEVIPVGVYPIHLDLCKGAKINNNILKRGWADQISLFGQEAQIIGNTIEDGQDYGITCHGANNIIGFNRVYHQGVVGILCGDSHSTVIGNDVWGCTWTNPIATASIAGILIDGPNTLVVGNKANGGGRAKSLYGISVFAFDGTTVTGCHLDGNHSTGHATADLSFAVTGSGTIPDIQLGINYATLIVDSTANTVASTIRLGNKAARVSTGTNNTVIGFGAAVLLTTGTSNVVLGASALQTGTSVSQCTAIGMQALATNTAWGMTAVGYNALVGNTTGTENVAVGYGALGANTSSGQNTAVGTNASSASTSGGITSLGATTVTGAANTTALGYAANASHASSVALGKSTATTAVDQTALGPRHLEMVEVTAPAAGATNSARIFAVDNGSGKTVLKVQFATGTAIQLAIEA